MWASRKCGAKCVLTFPLAAAGGHDCRGTSRSVSGYMFGIVFGEHFVDNNPITASAWIARARQIRRCFGPITNVYCDRLQSYFDDVYFRTSNWQ
jgi:hypothetical protein